MIVIAVLLLLIVAVFTVAVMVGNPGLVKLSIFGAHVPVTAAGLYFNGAGAMLVLVLALALLRRGFLRELRRRKQVRSLQSAANRRTRSSVDGGPATNSGTTPPVGDSRPPSAERQSLLDQTAELTGDGTDR